MALVSNPGEVTRPDLPWGLNSCLFSGYQDILPGVKWPGRGADQQGSMSLLPLWTSYVMSPCDLYMYNDALVFIV